jgi:hypothetical protein
MWILSAVTLPRHGIGAQVTRGLKFGAPKELLSKVELNAVSDVVLGPQGSVFVLDLTNYQVIALDSSGGEVWRAGRKGQGPGEFTLPYRLAVRPRGGVAVLDWGTGRVTLLSPAGRFDGMLQLPFPFTQIDGMAILPDGRYLIAGMTNWGAAGTSDHSLHLFSDSLAYQSSFASLAAAIDTSAVRYVGSGGFTINGSGQILFTPKRPYEIQRFTVDGRAIDRIVVKAPLRYDLGDFISVQRSNGHTFKTTTEKTKFVEIPAPVHELPSGGFLGGRGTFERTTIDLISPTGSLEASIVSPAGCVTILAVDTARSQVYCRALRNDVPQLLRVHFTIAQTGAKPRTMPR